MTCPYCHEEIPENAKYCPACGARAASDIPNVSNVFDYLPKPKSDAEKIAEAVVVEEINPDYEAKSKKANTLSVVSLVLTIVGTLMALIGIAIIPAYLSLPLSVIGLILATRAGKLNRSVKADTTLSTTALVVGIIATVLSVLSFLTCGLCMTLLLITDSGTTADPMMFIHF